MALIGVNIIESPNASDFLENRQEGAGLKEALRLHDIPSTIHTAVSAKAFRTALKQIARWHNDGDGLMDDRMQEAIPVIHISCHGNADGLAFTNGDELSWTELIEALEQFGKSMGERFVLAISACEGFCAYDGLKSLKQAPFACLIGTTDEPSWSETLVGFSTLYYQMNTGVLPLDAVEAMRTAALHEGFRSVAEGRFRADWEQLVQRARAAASTRKLQPSR